MLQAIYNFSEKVPHTASSMAAYLATANCQQKKENMVGENDIYIKYSIAQIYFILVNFLYELFRGGRIVCNVVILLELLFM